jgi:hypothetical protein
MRPSVWIERLDCLPTKSTSLTLLDYYLMLHLQRVRNFAALWLINQTNAELDYLCISVQQSLNTSIPRTRGNGLACDAMYCIAMISNNKEEVNFSRM